MSAKLAAAILIDGVIDASWLFIVAVGLSSGAVPGLQSLAMAILTPAERSASTGGS